MSLEAAIAKLTSEVELNRVATEKNNGLLSRVIEGQQAAMAKLDGATVTKVADKPATSTRKKKDSAPEKKKEEPAVVTQDDLKDAALPHLNSLKGEAKTEFTQFLNGMASHFGCSKLTGPDGINDADHLSQAVWYVERVKEGLPVDFNAEYDFTKPPTDPANAPAEDAEEDPFA